MTTKYRDKLAGLPGDLAPAVGPDPIFEAGSAHALKAAPPPFQPPPPATSSPSADLLAQIYSILTDHLGSRAAAERWLNSTKTGYPGTAMDVISAGKAHLVLGDLQAQIGPNSPYA